MSHLGDQLSALVDGELCGAELDRANAHVAACGSCRAEAQALRRLKHELRALADVEVGEPDDLTLRLLAMGRERAPRDAGQSVPARHLGRGRSGRRGVHAAMPRVASDPYAALSERRLRGRRRGRYVLWSTVSLVVIGMGTAFGMGGAAGGTGPRITPQLEVYDMQHAATSGDVPFEDPAAQATRVPAVAATP